MPIIIEHIDAIARAKGRDALFVEFRRIDGNGKGQEIIAAHEWSSWHPREKVIDWLDAKGIGWSPCGHIASTNMQMSYRGQIYIDIRYEPSDALYAELEGFLEGPNGPVINAGVRFYCLPYEAALANAAHDSPGFWEKWAEEF
ncbi:hypothetical protein [Pandoraea aquatica]|uniref:hypothetical protein n=1 Tax=Pandoraea aquatica TaxID=2508290 RepID=UPI001241D871|nr:hypothetical protein [Pandoraea aquatica]